MKRADILQRRRDGRRYRKRHWQWLRQANAYQERIMREVMRALGEYDDAVLRHKEQQQAVARQRLECVDWCSGIAECCGEYAGHCQKDPPHLVQSQCDWEDCPAPDCVNHGPCICLCHSGE